MAGSLKWFRYVSDAGDSYAILADESNTELVNTAAALSQTGVATLPPLPRRWKPRAVRLRSANGLINRLCVVLTQAQYASLNGATDFALDSTAGAEADPGAQVSLSYKVPERLGRLPRLGDTGKIDGDNP